MPPHIMPRDLRWALAWAAIGLSAMGLYAVYVGGELAMDSKTVPAFIAFVVTGVLAALAKYGKWVINYGRSTVGLDPIPDDDEDQP